MALMLFSVYKIEKDLNQIGKNLMSNRVKVFKLIILVKGMYYTIRVVIIIHFRTNPLLSDT